MTAADWVGSGAATVVEIPLLEPSPEPGVPAPVPGTPVLFPVDPESLEGEAGLGEAAGG